jgi:hypothetical protein
MPKKQRRMPVRTLPVSFEWEGETWSADMWSMPPSGLIDELFNEADDATERRKRMEGALVRLVQKWDFVDETGTDIPLPRDGGLAQCPTPLKAALRDAYFERWSPRAHPQKTPPRPPPLPRRPA